MGRDQSEFFHRIRAEIAGRRELIDVDYLNSAILRAMEMMDLSTVPAEMGKEAGKEEIERLEKEKVSLEIA